MYCFDIHDPSEVSRRDYIQFASIDPGKRNFTIRIERKFKNSTQVGCFKKLDLQIDDTIESSFNVLTKFFESIHTNLYECDYIFIEKQMKVNYNMIRLGQHALSYLLINLRNNPRRTKIYEVSSRNKNLIILPPKGTKPKALKDLSVVKAKEILLSRDDKISLDIIDFHKKKDDLCDVVCQLEAAIIKLKLDKEIESLPE